jgi:hypothetical protein
MPSAGRMSIRKSETSWTLSRAATSVVPLALADRLRALEEEQARLTRAEPTQSKVIQMFALPRLKERFNAIVQDLPAVGKTDPARARQLLRQLIGGHIRVLVEGDKPVLEFEMTGTRMLLAGGIPGTSDRVGSGGRI